MAKKKVAKKKAAKKKVAKKKAATAKVTRKTGKSASGTKHDVRQLRLIDSETNEEVGAPYRNEIFDKLYRNRIVKRAENKKKRAELKEQLADEVGKLLMIDEAIENEFNEMCQEQWPIIEGTLGIGVPYTTVTEKNKLRDIMVEITEVASESHIEVEVIDTKSRYKVMPHEDD